MPAYGVREVEKLLRLPRSTIRALIEAGFVAPERGPRNAWQFSFRDLVVLRTAQALASAQVPRQRITRSLKALRRQLPESMPLSGLSICAVADRVVVKEGARRWQAESGQYLLDFEGDPASGSMSVVERGDGARDDHARDWLERGLALEREAPGEAIEAYERAIAADPALLDAHVNLGALLHETGRHRRAERAYRKALERHRENPVLLYNLGVLLDETGRKHEAMDAYEAALRGDAAFADCHYNLALLCEELGRPKDAIRHMAHYRRLVGARSK